MNAGMTYSQLLLLGVARTGSVELVEEAVKRLLPAAPSKIPTLEALAERAEVAPVLLSVLPQLTAEEELHLARLKHLEPVILDHLARSTRKRTLLEVALREDTPGEVLERLAASKHEDVVRNVLGNPSLPSRERQRRWDEGDRSHVNSWAEADPEILHRALRERLAQLRDPDAEQVTTRLGRYRHLDMLPDEELDSEALDLVREILQELVAQKMYGEILKYSRTRPRGRALQDLVEALVPEGKDAETDALFGDVCKNLAVPVFGTPVRLQGGRTLGQWPEADEGSLRAAHSAGGEARLLALPHPALPAELRRAAVQSTDPLENAHVALNPALDEEDVALLLERLAPGQRWRLAGATLTPEQEELVLAGGPQVLHLILSLSSDLGEKLRERWLGERACRYVLAHRDKMLQKPAITTKVLNHVLDHHPALEREALDALRPGDVISGRHRDQVGAHLLAKLSTVEELSTFCSLLPEWQGSVGELLDTTEVLGQ